MTVAVSSHYFENQNIESLRRRWNCFGGLKQICQRMKGYEECVELKLSGDAFSKSQLLATKSGFWSISVSRTGNLNRTAEVLPLAEAFSNQNPEGDMCVSDFQSSGRQTTNIILVLNFHKRAVACSGTVILWYVW